MQKLNLGYANPVGSEMKILETGNKEVSAKLKSAEEKLAKAQSRNLEYVVEAKKKN